MEDFKPRLVYWYLLKTGLRRSTRSGTTMIAAEQLGRKACLMELDERYADVIIERYEKFTGKKAQRIR